MPVEIERKFLVRDKHFLNEAHKSVVIKQGFLNSDKNRVVRVRTSDDSGYLTIKGISDASGLKRMEWEYEIPRAEAEALLAICEPTIIEKTRYYIRNGSLEFEVDVFEKENEGLMVAEIELPDENTAFTKPHWLGKEVTGEVKYYNASLSKHPFNSWA